jgi:hypothetical protein
MMEICKRARTAVPSESRDLFCSLGEKFNFSLAFVTKIKEPSGGRLLSLTRENFMSGKARMAEEGKVFIAQKRQRKMCDSRKVIFQILPLLDSSVEQKEHFL